MYEVRAWYCPIPEKAEYQNLPTLGVLVVAVYCAPLGNAHTHQRRANRTNDEHGRAEAPREGICIASVIRLQWCTGLEGVCAKTTAHRRPAGLDTTSECLFGSCRGRRRMSLGLGHRRSSFNFVQAPGTPRSLRRIFIGSIIGI